MTPMIEIFFSDGTIRRVPESYFTAGGEVMIPVLDVGFNSLEEGLVLYFLHYEPERPDETMIDRQIDPRGLSAAFYNDSYAVIVPPERMHLVDRVYYEGELQLVRVETDGPLVNMKYITELEDRYMPARGSRGGIMARIAELYAAIYADTKMELENTVEADKMPSDEEIKAKACAAMGVTRAFVEKCVAFVAVRPGDEGVTRDVAGV